MNLNPCNAALFSAKDKNSISSQTTFGLKIRMDKLDIFEKTTPALKVDKTLLQNIESLLTRFKQLKNDSEDVIVSLGIKIKAKQKTGRLLSGFVSNADGAISAEISKIRMEDLKNPLAIDAFIVKVKALIKKIAAENTIYNASLGHTSKKIAAKIAAFKNASTISFVQKSGDKVKRFEIIPFSHVTGNPFILADRFDETHFRSVFAKAYENTPVYRQTLDRVLDKIAEKLNECPEGSKVALSFLCDSRNSDLPHILISAKLDKAGVKANSVNLFEISQISLLQNTQFNLDLMEKAFESLYKSSKQS